MEPMGPLKHPPYFNPDLPRGVGVFGARENRENSASAPPLPLQRRKVVQQHPPFPTKEQWVDLIANNKVSEIKELIEKNPRLVNEKIPGIDLYLFEMVALHPDQGIAADLMRIVADEMEDFDCPDENGNTLLHWAYLHSDAYAEILLEYNAEPGFKNSQGISPTLFMRILKKEIPAPLRPYIEKDPLNTGSKTYRDVSPIRRTWGFTSDRSQPVVSKRYNETCNIRDPEQRLFSWAVGHSFRRIIWEKGRELAYVRPNFRAHGTSYQPSVEETIAEYVDIPGEKKRFYVSDLIVPLNKDEDHWVLVIVDTETKQILTFNSMESDGQPDFSALAGRLGYEHRRMATEGQQQDDINCGVYMNLYLQVFLQGIREGKNIEEIDEILDDMAIAASVDPEMEIQRIQEYRQEVADNVAEMKWLSKVMKARALRKYEEASRSWDAKQEFKDRIADFKQTHYPNWELEWFELYRNGVDLFDYYQCVGWEERKWVSIDDVINRIRGLEWQM